MADFSFENYSGLLNTGTLGTSREIYSEDAGDGTRTRNRGVASSGPIIGIVTYHAVACVFGRQETVN